MTALLRIYGRLVAIDPEYTHPFIAYLEYKRQQNPYWFRGMSWLLVLAVMGLGS